MALSEAQRKVVEAMENLISFSENGRFVRIPQNIESPLQVAARAVKLAVRLQEQLDAQASYIDQIRAERDQLQAYHDKVEVERSQWVSVEERTNQTRAIGYDAFYEEIGIVEWNGNRFVFEGDRDDCAITHFQEIPDPPSGPQPGDKA